MLFKNRLLVIYRHGDRISEASMRYLKWFYNIIYRIPMDIIDSLDFIKAPENLPLITNNIYNHIMIFLLSSISGEGEDSWLLSMLNEVNGRVPIVTFYRAPYAFNKNPIAKDIFNLYPVHENEGYIKNVSITDKTLSQGVEWSSVRDPISSYNSASDKDHFVTIEPLEKDKNYRPLMLYNNQTIAAQYGLNIFIGQKGVAIPREDRALEFDRPIYFLRLLDNLLKKSAAGYLRLKLTNWPVVLRMDDPPTTWQLTSQKRKILTPKDYAKVINILTKYRAKMTCFVTPTHVSKNGRVKPWTETNHDNAKKTLRILGDGVKKGIIEIGSHGLTHLTIGYKPPSITTTLLSKVSFAKYNLAREFYDSKLGKEIPYELQKRQLDGSMKLVEGFFGSKPKAFAPPAHAWDDSTEKALLKMGIPYFSADMNFYLYSEGYEFRKNPSPIGETTCNGDLLYVSATILSSYGTFQKTLKLFNELGVPLVWQQHNFHPSWFTPEILESFSKDVELFGDKTYMWVSELGDLLRRYRRIESHATLENGCVKFSIKTEMPIIIEAYYNEKIQVRKIPAGHHWIELNLRSPSTLMA